MLWWRSGGVSPETEPAAWGAQGVGLVWPTTLGRLEVNWCRVLAQQPTDIARQGIEVGFTPVFS